MYERCVGGKIKTNDESELCVVKDVSQLVPNSLELNKRTRDVSALLNDDLSLEKKKGDVPFFRVHARAAISFKSYRHLLFAIYSDNFFLRHPL